MKPLAQLLQFREVRVGFTSLGIGAGVILLGFLLGEMSPVDPARVVLGPFADQQAVEQLRKELRLDQAPAARFAAYLGHVVRADLGTSWVTRSSVASEVGAALLQSAKFCVPAMVLALLISYAVAVFRFLHPYGHLLLGMLNTLTLAPGFVVALGAALLVTLLLPWMSISAESALGRPSLFAAMIVALAALHPTAKLSMILAGRFDVLRGSTMYRAAVATGHPPADLLHRVLLRNAAAVWLAAWLVEISGILVSTLMLELVFSIPGLSALILRSVLQGILLVLGFFAMLFHFAVTNAEVRLDPRAAV